MEKIFKDVSGKVHVIEEDFNHLLPEGCVEITQQEADELNKPAPLTYAQLRAAAYPPIAEQLDMQFKDAMNGTTVWADTIAAIKEKYPKP